MPDNKSFFLLRKNLNRKNFLILLGFGSVTLFAVFKKPFRIFKKRITEKSSGFSVEFKENPFSVKRNKV